MNFKKWIEILVRVVEIMRILVGMSPRPEVANEHVDAIAIGLDMSPEIPEVVAARRRIEDVKKMSDLDRTRHAGDIADAQAIVEKHAVVAEPALTSPGRTLSILDKIKAAEAARKKTP